MNPAPPFDEWFSLQHGLPQPVWWSVLAWMRAEVESDNENEFWHLFVREWLRRLGAALGPHYVTDESENFHLLSTLSGGRRADALKFLEGTRASIQHVLGEHLMPRGVVGKHVVLRFAKEGDYCRYVSHFHPEGERAMSGGTFLNAGYMHVATFEQVDANRIGPVLVHELAHNLTCYLPQPLWLNEALAMFFEYDIARGARDGSLLDVVDKHREFWNPETIQQFWHGRSFSAVAGQEVSYSLADTLFRLIRSDLRPSPESLRRFVLAADWNDAGDAAARRYLGISLEDLAGIFLGPGDWSPKPETWKKEDPVEVPSAELGTPDENGFVWPEGLEPEPKSK